MGPEAPAPRAVAALPGQGAARRELRAFPLSDWTELDIWQYIGRESIPLPSIYFSHRRPVVERDGMLLAVSDWVTPAPASGPWRRPCASGRSATPPAPAPSAPTASTVEEIITEVAASRVSERGATRADDRFSETAMEDRKREGYF